MKAKAKGQPKKKPGRPGRPNKTEGDDGVFARRRRPPTIPACLRWEAIVRVFESEIVPKLEEAELPMSCWEVLGVKIY